MYGITITVGNFFFRWRDTAFSFIFLLAFVILGVRPEWIVGSLSTDLAMTSIGFLFALSGQIVRAVTIGLAYIKRGGLDKKIYAETLVRRGMFAHCRNPLYLGNILIVTGAIFAVNIVWYYAIALPAFYYIYLAITLAEEKYLGQKFGEDYQAYLREVNRFIPGNLGDWSASTDGMSFTWKRFIKKEHGSTVIIFAGIALALILKLHFRHHFAFSDQVFFPLWIGMAILLVFQVTAAILKRNGRLEWDPDRP